MESCVDAQSTETMDDGRPGKLINGTQSVRKLVCCESMAEASMADESDTARLNVNLRSHHLMASGDRVAAARAS